MAGNISGIEIYENEISYERLQINPEDFYETSGTPMPSYEPFLSELEEVIAVGKNISRARSLFRMLDTISVARKDFSIDNIGFNCGSKIARQLRNAEQLIVFVCTSGHGITQQYKEYIDTNELVKAYFVDILGNIIVEKAMDIIQERISEEMKTRGMNITNRYSPGYCNWNTNEQAKIFSMLPDNPCGVKLTQSSLMIPSKSISGVIGCGKNVKYTDYGCQLCELEMCIYRKNGNNTFNYYG